MRVTIQVGAVAVDLRGVDMSTRAIRALIDQCAARNDAIESPPEAEPEERQPMGFTVITDRDTEGPPEEHRFTDDD